ncbi:hypothetical protein Kirov_116 [Bacillus phage Kirov]|uniref:Uncharacterized protein n=1 Tax=Bacillus phage Kirov TaxID=2783539 RepID=A0A7U3NKG5_9CAUD|nr:hypothetical protein PQE67_gp188 [Bacillus phage Kirov]QOV08315.1 hypothetical protein Kirov_116 [Bacillus phage Kirov]
MIAKIVMELIFLALASYMLYIDRDKGRWLTTLWSILIIYFLSWALADSYILIGGRI